MKALYKELALGISCLQYANDTLLLLPSNLVSIARVKILIYNFKLPYGLSINFAKSSVYFLALYMRIGRVSLLFSTARLGDFS